MCGGVFFLNIIYPNRWGNDINFFSFNLPYSWNYSVGDIVLEFSLREQILPLFQKNKEYKNWHLCTLCQLLGTFLQVHVVLWNKLAFSHSTFFKVIMLKSQVVYFFVCKAFLYFHRSDYAAFCRVFMTSWNYFFSCKCNISFSWFSSKYWLLKIIALFFPQNIRYTYFDIYK